MVLARTGCRKQGSLGARWWLAAPILLLLQARCSNDYPVAPTPCDDWCHASNRPSCEYFQPLGCVEACEYAGGKPRSAECQLAWDAAIDCLLQQPDDLICDERRGQAPAPCDAEKYALFVCREKNGEPAR